MFLFGRKKDEDPDTVTDDDIIVVHKPPPNACGGTYATQRKSAPTEIESEDMVSFFAECSFRVCSFSDEISEDERITFISASAEKAAKGTLLVLDKSIGYGSERSRPQCVLIKEDIFPRLVQLVREQQLAKGNGYHSNTAGLPENFGGSVDIRFSSGERIDCSNNQCPIFGIDTAIAIAKVFDTAMQGEKVPLPDVKDIEKIVYDEERENGGFTKATLTLLPDGTGTNAKTSRYEDEKVYESEKPVDAETILKMKQNITNCLLFAWEGLPKREPVISNVSKKLTFLFKDGSELTVHDNCRLPYSISNGFFNIELEMTTKH